MRGTARERTKRDRDRRRDCDRHLRQALRATRSMRRVQRLPRRRLRRGVVVWAHVPFSDTDDWKLRPGLVIGADAGELRLHPITSAVSRLGRDGYLEIVDLDAVGLDRPSRANLRRVVEIPLIEAVSIAGELSLADAVRFEVHASLLAVMDLPDLAPARDLVVRAVRGLAVELGSSGGVPRSALDTKLRRLDPGFDPGGFGCTDLDELLDRCRDLVEVRAGAGGPELHLRPAPARPSTQT